MRLALILLTVTWCALTRDVGLANVALGAAMSWLALRFVAMPGTRLGWVLTRLPALCSLGLFFAWEMIHSNLRMALVVLAPGRHLRPAILAVPVEVESDAELALLSNLVTLTPGTLGLDVSDDREQIYVHVLTADCFDAARSDIQQGLARRVRKLFAC